MNKKIIEKLLYSLENANLNNENSCIVNNTDLIDLLESYNKLNHDFRVLQAFSYNRNDYIRKDKLKNKLLNDIKSINEKLYNARNEHMNIFRYYRLKGIKTKAKELLNYIEKE